MSLKWPIGSKIGAGYGLALLVLIAISLLAVRETTALITDANWVTHTHQTLETLDRVLLHLVDIETSARGYVIAGADDFLAPYQAARPLIDEDLAALRTLTANNPSQQQRLATLGPLIDQRIEAAQGLITTRQERGFAAAAQLVAAGTGKDLMDQIREVMAEMMAEEQGLLAQRAQRAQATAQGVLLAILLGTATGVLVVGGGSLILTRGLTGSVRQLAVGAEQIGAGRLDHRIPTLARDELGDLAQAFNRMAGNLAEAQAELQTAHIQLEHRVEERTAELQRVNRALRVLSDGNQMLVRAEAESDLLQQICRLIVDTGGYRLAWVGYAERDAARTVRPMAQAGLAEPDQAVLERLSLSWADNEQAQLPLGVAIRTGQPTVVRVGAEAADSAWRTEALERGYAACLAIPLKVEAGILGALGIFADDPEAFDEVETKLLTELADDLAYGLASLRTRAAHQRAEAALHESLERYHRTLDHMLEGCQLIDFDWRYVYINDAAARQGRRPQAELLGQTMLDMYPGIEATPLFATLQRCMTERTSHHLENEFAYPDGATGWYELSIQPVPEGIFILSVDISERKRAEAQWRDSQAQLAGIINSAMDAIVAVDADQRVTLFNAAAEKMFATSHAAALGQALDQFIPARFRDRHREHLRHFGDHHQTMRRMGVLNGLTGLRADHTEFPIEASISQVEVAGQKIFTAIVRDITEREQAAERLRRNEQVLRLFVEHSPAAIAMLDRDLRYLLVSRRFLVDYDLGDQNLVGRSHYDVFPNVPERWKDVHRRCLAGAIESSEEDPFPRADGRLDWVHWEIHPWYEHTGEIGGLILFSEIVTERKRLMEQVQHSNADLERRVTERTAELAVATANLEAARDEAVRANQAKSEFLSRMSHELRTPLNAILGFAQILGMTTLEPDHQEGVKHILASGRHLLTLINEVLDIARIETGRLSFSPEPVMMSEVMQEALDLIQPLADQRQIQLNLAETSDRYVRADHQRLKQVLLNLLSNAVKYNRRGGQVTVTIRLRSEAGAANALRLAVTDTGPGIPAHKLGRLFTPFDRLDAEDGQVPGTGLGLALSKNLVEAMGGALGVDTEAGQGSTFWVDLPLAEAPTARIKRTGELLTLSTAPLTRPKTVLYVEDNLSNQHLVEQILAYRPTLRLITTMQAQLSVDLAREHQPALILLDLNLPDMHGSQLLKLLQADPRTQSIPVVVISADATAGQIERLLAAGARAYLTKPFDVKQFLQVIDEMLA